MAFEVAGYGWKKLLVIAAVAIVGISLYKRFAPAQVKAVLPL